MKLLPIASLSPARWPIFFTAFVESLLGKEKSGESLKKSFIDFYFWRITLISPWHAVNQVRKNESNRSRLPLCFYFICRLCSLFKVLSLWGAKERLSAATKYASIKGDSAIRHQGLSVFNIATSQSAAIWKIQLEKTMSALEVFFSDMFLV